jgi:hypothetical protein
VKIDEIPLDWCMRPGVKLDFRDLPDGHVMTSSEIDAELKRIGHELQSFDIVSGTPRRPSASARGTTSTPAAASAATPPSTWRSRA